MKAVLDACAVVALLNDEPASEHVAELISAGDVALTALGFAEVVDLLVRRGGGDADDVLLDLAEVDLSKPIPVDGVLAANGALLRAAHYHRQRCTVSLADCIAAAAARDAGAPLVTTDPDLLDVCEAEGIEVVALPDSTGAVWSPR